MTKDERVSKDTLEAIREAVSIVRHFVNNPDDVQVRASASGYNVVVVLETDPNDVGQVIGKNAYLINSVRSIVSAIAGKNAVRAHIEYVTEEDKRRSGPDGFNRQRA